MVATQDELAKNIANKLRAVVGDRDGLEELSDVFNSIDADGSGALDQEEFRNALLQFGIDITREEVAAVVSASC